MPGTCVYRCRGIRVYTRKCQPSIHLKDVRNSLLGFLELINAEAVCFHIVDYYHHPVEMQLNPITAA